MKYINQLLKSIRCYWEVACGVSTCRSTDFFATCSAGKICGSDGCYDCPAGSHQCPRDQGFWHKTCPNDQQCHSTGCVTSTGIDQETYLADKSMCCGTTPTTTSRNNHSGLQNPGASSEKKYNLWQLFFLVLETLPVFSIKSNEIQQNFTSVLLYMAFFSIEILYFCYQ